MKKLLFIIPLLFLISSCSNNDSSGSNPTGTIGGGLIGGGGTGNVTITVSVVQDGQGQQYFQFTPSTGVVVDQVGVKCDAQGVDETVPGDGQTVYTMNDGFSVGPLTDGVLQTGQQWNFTIQGKVGSANGTAYTATPTYTVP